MNSKTTSIKEIQILRSQMIKVGMKNGLTHPKTIQISQALDKMLNEYSSI